MPLPNCKKDCPLLHEAEAKLAAADGIRGEIMRVAATSIDGYKARIASLEAEVEKLTGYIALLKAEKPARRRKA